jgi:hypothetical protein
MFRSQIEMMTLPSNLFKAGVAIHDALWLASQRDKLLAVSTPRGERIMNLVTLRLSR